MDFQREEVQALAFRADDPPRMELVIRVIKVPSYFTATMNKKITKRGRIAWRKLGALIGSPNFLCASIPGASLYLRKLNTELATRVRSNGWNG
jgi:hypothetical protein